MTRSVNFAAVFRPIVPVRGSTANTRPASRPRLGRGRAGGRSARAAVAVLLTVGAALGPLPPSLARSWRTLPETSPTHPSTAAPLPDRIVRGDPNAAINAFWRRQLERLAANHPPERSEEMVAHAGRIAAVLRDLDLRAPDAVTFEEVTRPAGGPQPSILAAALEGLAREYARRRDRRLAEALAGFEASPIEPDDPSVQRAFQSAVDDVRSMHRRFTAFARLTVRFDACFDAGEPCSEIAGAWSAHPLASDPALRGVLEPVRSRVEAVRRIDTESDPKALVEIIEAGNAALGSVISAWRRLGNIPGLLWPADASDLRSEQRAASRIRAGAIGLPAEAREALLAEVSSESARRARRALATAGDDDLFAEARRALAGAGADPVELDPPVRFNLLLFDLKQALNDPATPAEPAAREFLERVKALPGGIVYRADAAAVTERIERALAGGEARAADQDATRLGPGSLAGRFEARADGPFVTFTPIGGGVPLKFMRIDADGAEGPPPFYLSVHEVSVAMFQVMLGAGAGPRSAPSFLRRTDPFADPRIGPRTWEWAPRGGTIRPAREWLAITTPGQYGPEGEPPPPTLDHPMQYISPEAADRAARLVGCRLPTPAEWRAADRQFGQGIPAEQLNLRDQTWARHDEHVRCAVAAGRNLQPASAGSYDPDGGLTSPSDDRTLWFAEVHAGGGASIHHLRGNVAEWLAEPSGDGSGLMVTYEVAGGSSLSDASDQGRDPRRVDPGAASEGFADVGFRLAFDAPDGRSRPATLEERLREALVRTPYLRAR